MMNGPFFPMFNDYDDGFVGRPYQRSYGGYGSSPMSSARRALEERQRRAEMDRYNQWKRQQQQQQQILRQRHEEEERQRRLLQEERLRRQQQQQRQQYSIVRGPDGRLYRVPVESDDAASVSSQPKNSPRQQQQRQQQQQQQNQSTYVRGPDGRIYLVQRPVEKRNVSVVDEKENHNHVKNLRAIKFQPTKEQKQTSPLNTTTSFKNATNISAVNDDDNSVKVEIGPSNKKDATQVKVTVKHNDDDNVNGGNKAASDAATTSHRRRRRVTVIVEDVPESEIEADETKSIWRNRRPGPGESWMEPIAEV